MVNVVFCFDNRIVDQAKVAIISLLGAGLKDNLTFNVYCLCSKGAETCEEDLRRLIYSHSPQSKLTVIAIENSPFANSYEIRDISTATYFRLMLPSLLPDIDKIIYFDVDLLFLNSIREIWEMEIHDAYVLGVKGSVNTTSSWQLNSKRDYWGLLEDQKGKYINAGVLVMNLKKIREDNLEKEWIAMSDRIFYYQDQDIINITCKGKIGYLPPKFNYQSYVSKNDYLSYVSEGIFNSSELNEAMEFPAIIHYSGEKPWNNCYINFADLWWDFVESDEELKKLFNHAKVRFISSPCNILKTQWKRVLRKIGRLQD